jgi:hypothetical protein
VSGLAYPDIAAQSVRVPVRVAALPVRVERGPCPGCGPSHNPDTHPPLRVVVSGFRATSETASRSAMPTASPLQESTGVAVTVAVSRQGSIGDGPTSEHGYRRFADSREGR